MPTTYKVLAQSAPSATTATDIYTVASATQVVISTVTVCNRSGSAATFRIAVRPNGATLANQHYVCYGVSVPPTDTIALTLGLTIDAADVVTVYASSADLTFNLFGSEIA
jgi:hypothetical protein